MTDDSIRSLKEIRDTLRTLTASQQNMNTQLMDIHVKIVGSEYFPEGLVQQMANHTKKFEAIDEKFDEYDRLLSNSKLVGKIIIFLSSVVTLKFLIDAWTWIKAHL